MRLMWGIKIRIRVTLPSLPRLLFKLTKIFASGQKRRHEEEKRTFFSFCLSCSFCLLMSSGNKISHALAAFLIWLDLPPAKTNNYLHEKHGLAFSYTSLLLSIIMTDINFSCKLHSAV